jgi:hypothetical protein
VGASPEMGVVKKERDLLCTGSRNLDRPGCSQISVPTTLPEYDEL